MSTGRSLICCLLCVLCVLCGEFPAPIRPPRATSSRPEGSAGTSVEVRVGGLFLHDKCRVRSHRHRRDASPTLMPAQASLVRGAAPAAAGIAAAGRLPRRLPARSQSRRTHRSARVAGACSRRRAGRAGRCSWSASLPEVVEHEIDGEPIPRADHAAGHGQRPHLPARGHRPVGVRRPAGQTVTAFVHAAVAQLAARCRKLDILDAKGNVVVGADAPRVRRAPTRR